MKKEHSHSQIPILKGREPSFWPVASPPRRRVTPQKIKKYGGMSLKIKPVLRNPSPTTRVAPTVSSSVASKPQQSLASRTSSSSPSLNLHKEKGNGGGQGQGQGGGGGPHPSHFVGSQHSQQHHGRIITLMCVSFATVIFLLFGLSSSSGASTTVVTTQVDSRGNVDSGEQTEVPTDARKGAEEEETKGNTAAKTKSIMDALIGRHIAKAAEEEQALAADRLGAGSRNRRRDFPLKNDRREEEEGKESASQPKADASKGNGTGQSQSQASSSGGVVSSDGYIGLRSRRQDLIFSQYDDVDNIVFSCFYDNTWVNHVPATSALRSRHNQEAAPPPPPPPFAATREAVQNFYVGSRKVPTLDWIEVFIRSLEGVTRDRAGLRRAAHSTISDSSGKGQSDHLSRQKDLFLLGLGSGSETDVRPSELPLDAVERVMAGDNTTRLVMFVDFMTWLKLRPKVADILFRPSNYLEREMALSKRKVFVDYLKKKSSNYFVDDRGEIEKRRDDAAGDGKGRDNHAEVDERLPQDLERQLTAYLLGLSHRNRVTKNARSDDRRTHGNSKGSRSSLLSPRRPLVHFVVVAFPKDEGLLKTALESVPVEDYPEVVVPRYLNSRWAADVRNGANNFRFALYRDWLTRFVEARREKRRDSGAAKFASALLVPEDVQSLLKVKIVVADATDVAFQRNPFRQQWSATSRDDKGAGGCFGHSEVTSAYSVGLGTPSHLPMPVVIATQENSRMTFKKEKYNRRWMTCIDHGKALPQLARAHKPVLCAGVTLGNGAGMYSYFTAQLLQIIRPSLVDCSLSVISAALDQATHNYIIHTAQLSSSDVSETATQKAYQLLAEALLNTSNSRGNRVESEGKHSVRLFTFPSPPKDDAEATSSVGHPAPEYSDGEAPLPVSLVLTNHERDHCTFHGNFGQLKTISVPVPSEEEEEDQDGDDSLRKSPSSASAADSKTTILAVNPDGKVYDIVHQYSSDRHPPLMKALAERYLNKKGHRYS